MPKAIRTYHALKSEGADKLLLYKKLVTLRRDVPLPDSFSSNNLRFVGCRKIDEKQGRGSKIGDVRTFPNSPADWVQLAPSLITPFNILLNYQFEH